MKKVVRIGNSANGNVFCKIAVTDGRLSITGVIGPKANGDARGSCGQIVMGDWGIVEYAPGWDAAKEEMFRKVWDLYHLNDMQAGSPAQTAHLRKLEAAGTRYSYSREEPSHYEWACKRLSEGGLQPDPDHIRNGKPYRYGSAWLKIEVPAETLAWLQALPDTDIRPAWV